VNLYSLAHVYFTLEVKELLPSSGWNSKPEKQPASRIALRAQEVAVQIHRVFARLCAEDMLIPIPGHYKCLLPDFTLVFRSAHRGDCFSETSVTFDGLRDFTCCAVCQPSECNPSSRAVCPENKHKHGHAVPALGGGGEFSHLCACLKLRVIDSQYGSSLTTSGRHVHWAV
jgi:hypothetical protein